MDEIEESDIDQNFQTEVQNTCFYFVVDRSGSMGGSRIEIAKKALQLFM